MINILKKRRKNLKTVLILALQKPKPVIKTTSDAVDHFIARFMRVSPGAAARARMIAFLDGELGTSDIVAAASYMEQPLRMTLHLVMSQPEYQLD